MPARPACPFRKTIGYARKPFVGVGLHKHYFWGHTKGVQSAGYNPHRFCDIQMPVLMASKCPAKGTRRNRRRHSCQQNKQPSSKLTAEAWRVLANSSMAQWRQWDKKDYRLCVGSVKGQITAMELQYLAEFLISKIQAGTVAPESMPDCLPSPLLAKLFMDTRRSVSRLMDRHTKGRHIRQDIHKEIQIPMPRYSDTQIHGYISAETFR